MPTTQEKTARVIQWLCESHLYSFGGYPYDYAKHGEFLFVAELDNAKERHQTAITVWTLSALPVWYDAAAAYVAQELGGDPDGPGEWSDEWDCLTDGEFNDSGWSEAFFETQGQIPNLQPDPAMFWDADEDVPATP